jgi:hypothetical protein
MLPKRDPYLNSGMFKLKCKTAPRNSSARTFRAYEDNKNKEV